LFVLNPYVDLAWWLTPVITATWETEIRRITIYASPETSISKHPPQSISQEWSRRLLFQAQRTLWVGRSQSDAGPEKKCETLPEKKLKPKQQQKEH
jgi:hypothetical protein